MKKIIQSALLTAFLCGIAVAEDELDAALNELKKKAPRRDYSDRAVLHNRDMTVPDDPTEQNRALDAKLRVMEKSIQADSPGVRPAPRMRPMRPLPQQEERGNWLTPAMLDNSAMEEEPQNTPDSWITTELERRNEIELLKEEQEQIDLKVQEELRKTETSALNPAASYNRSLQEIIGGQTREREPSSSAGYNRPISSLTPYSTRRSSSPSLFPAPGTSRSEAGTSSIQPFSVKRSPLKSPTDYQSNFKSDKPAPLPPIKKLRRSSFDNNPFSDDIMPRVNKGIWDK